MGISLAFIAHPSALSLFQDCPVLLAVAFFSCRVFCIPCASFWFSGFTGFSRPLSALVYLFHGGRLLPFELFATRLLPSSLIFLYTFSSILLPSPASRQLCAGSFFFSSVLLNFPLQLSLLSVRLLVLGTFVLLLFLLFPTLFPGCAC